MITITLTVVAIAILSAYFVFTSDHNTHPELWRDSDYFDSNLGYYTNGCRYGVSSTFGWHDCISGDDWRSYIKNTNFKEFTDAGLNKISLKTVSEIEIGMFEKQYNINFDTPSSCSEYESWFVNNNNNENNGWCKINRITGYDMGLDNSKNQTHVSYVKGKVIEINWNGIFSIVLESGKSFDFKEKQNIELGNTITIKNTVITTECGLLRLYEPNVTGTTEELYSFYIHGGEINGTKYLGLKSTGTWDDRDYFNEKYYNCRQNESRSVSTFEIMEIQK
jgi:hypothetical protein